MHGRSRVPHRGRECLIKNQKGVGGLKMIYYCYYCREEHEDSKGYEKSEEHIIPKKLGNKSYVLKHVCKSRNNLLASVYENPFYHTHLYRLLNETSPLARGGAPVIEQGHHALMSKKGGGVNLTLLKPIEENVSELRVGLKLPSGEEKSFKLELTESVTVGIQAKSGDIGKLMKRRFKNVEKTLKDSLKKHIENGGECAEELRGFTFAFEPKEDSAKFDNAELRSFTFDEQIIDDSNIVIKCYLVRIVYAFMCQEFPDYAKDSVELGVLAQALYDFIIKEEEVVDVLPEYLNCHSSGKASFYTLNDVAVGKDVSELCEILQLSEDVASRVKNAFKVIDQCVFFPFGGVNVEKQMLTGEKKRDFHLLNFPFHLNYSDGGHMPGVSVYIELFGRGKMGTGLAAGVRITRDDKTPYTDRVRTKRMPLGK